MNVGAWIVLAVYTVLGFVMWGYAKYQQKNNPLDWEPVVLNPDTVDKIK